MSDFVDGLIMAEVGEQGRPQMVTVADIVMRLQKLPGTLPLVIPGYENDFDPVFVVCKQSVRRAHNSKWWDGVLVKANWDDEDAIEVLVFGMRSSEESLDDRQFAVAAFPEEAH